MPYRIKNAELARMTMNCLDAISMVNRLAAELGFDPVKAAKPRTENHREYLSMFATMYGLCMFRDENHKETTEVAVAAIAQIIGLYLEREDTPAGVREKFARMVEKI